jgi:RNA polymerase-binding transcription factor DksA
MVSQDLSTELHEQLLAERERLGKEIENIRAGGIRADVFDADEQDSYDQHPADAGSELFEREKNMSVMRTLEVQLDEVDNALQKFEQGTYGQCESCGKPISEKRLRAFPAAIHCIECQSKIDSGQAPV